MSKFKVTFSETTQSGLITKALNGLPDYEKKSQQGSTFVFTATWGTDPKSLNNLKGRIEETTGRGSVTAIGKG